MNLRVLVALVFACCGACAFFNPYMRAGSHMLQRQDSGVRFCWADINAPSEKVSCRDERLAHGALWQCVEQLRSNATMRTTERDADRELESCMTGKG
jgi:hypothetical protein